MKKPFIVNVSSLNKHDANGFYERAVIAKDMIEQLEKGHDIILIVVGEKKEVKEGLEEFKRTLNSINFNDFKISISESDREMENRFFNPFEISISRT